MKRYTVVWDSEGESPFIDAWIDADSQMREMLTEIANWVDANLAERPEDKGQADLDGARVLAVPLSRWATRASVAYHVFPNDRLVRIIRLTLRGQ